MRFLYYRFRNDVIYGGIIGSWNNLKQHYILGELGVISWIHPRIRHVGLLFAAMFTNKFERK